MRTRFAALAISSAVVCCSLAVSPALGAYYYYGVANDEFTADNDTLWSALSEWNIWDVNDRVLRDNWNADDLNRGDGRDSMYDDLVWYAENLAAGDVFLFAYWGHGAWNATDEGPQEDFPHQSWTPQYNDPEPEHDPPWYGDEFFGYVGGSTRYMYDDDFTDCFASFDAGVEVIVVSGACHAGGWVGGGEDLDKSAPGDNHGLYALLANPENAWGCAIGSGAPYEILLCKAMANTLVADMKMSAWSTATVAYGAAHTSYETTPWNPTPQDYYYWPAADWVPTEYEKTYHTDHWGWEESYLQLGPISYSSLDAGHDRYIGNPEPGTLALVGIGLIGCAVLRRRKAGT